MTSEHGDYILALLKDSGRLNDSSDLTTFLRKLDTEVIENLLDDEITAASSSTDKTLYQRYPNYEKHWLEHLKTLKGIILSGETNLSRVIKKSQDIFAIRHMKKFEKAVILGKVKKLPYEVITPWRDAIVLEWLSKNCEADIPCVIETGSGTAVNLFKFWLTNGPGDADYYGLEITQTGRLCANILASLEPDLSFASLFFDYQKPDFSELKKKYKKIFVFTRGSIEQIPKLPEAFFTNLLCIAGKITCVHFEPVGWQLFNPYRQNLLTRKIRNACLRRNYNTNLWSLLKDFENNKMIKIHEYQINLTGKERNSGTYILWTKLPKKTSQS